MAPSVEPGDAGRAVRPADLVVVGAGVAGLVAAWRARRRDPAARVVVLEAGERPGGVLASEQRDGFLVEHAASAIRRGADAIHALIEELGLTGEMVGASDRVAARRFVLHRGRLVAAPSGPLSLAATPLLSTGAKLRLLAEPFQRAAPRCGESVAEFIARRAGRGLVAPLLDAVVTGIFAGDVERLEAASAFPRMVALEERHGSLLRGAWAARLGTEARAARRERARRPALAALRGGMGRLAERLVEQIEAGSSQEGAKRGGERDGGGRGAGSGEVRCRAPVVAIERIGGASGWRVTTAGGERIAAPRLVLALPAWHATRLLAPIDAELAAECAAVDAAPLAVVAIGVARSRVGADLDALGFLVPRAERRALLGVLCESSLFPDRAPAGHVLLRAMVGGDRAELPRDPAAIAARAWDEVAPLLALRGPPQLLAAIPHRPGIPQYRPGHAARRARIAVRLAALPGLALAGWSWSGIALDDRAAEPA